MLPNHLKSYPVLMIRGSNTQNYNYSGVGTEDILWGWASISASALGRSLRASLLVVRLALEACCYAMDVTTSQDWCYAHLGVCIATYSVGNQSGWNFYGMIVVMSNFLLPQLYTDWTVFQTLHSQRRKRRTKNESSSDGMELYWINIHYTFLYTYTIQYMYETYAIWHMCWIQSMHLGIQ